MPDESCPGVPSREVVSLDGVDHPHLVLGPGGGHVETLFALIGGHRSDPPALASVYDQREDHHVALIALE